MNDVTPYPIEEQVSIKIADDLFIKTYEINQRHVMLPQHSHEYDHVSLISNGAVRVWKDDVLIGDFHAPQAITIERHCKHKFLTLTDRVTLSCIHHLHDTDEVEVHDENNITDTDLEYLKNLRD